MLIMVSLLPCFDYWFISRACNCYSIGASVGPLLDLILRFGFSLSAASTLEGLGHQNIPGKNKYK